MIYLQLLVSFFQVGLFGIGGGYATLPLIQDQVVTLHHWLTMKEFTDVITISQMTPGPIAINSATFVGIRVAGMAGAIIATLVHFTVVHYRHGCIAFLFQIQKPVDGAGDSRRPAACGCGAYSFGRYFNPAAGPVQYGDTDAFPSKD